MTLDSTLKIRCSEAQKAAWQAFAAGRGKSLSSWIKECLDTLASSGKLLETIKASLPAPKPQKVTERKPETPKSIACEGCTRAIGKAGWNCYACRKLNAGAS